MVRYVEKYSKTMVNQQKIHTLKYESRYLNAFFDNDNKLKSMTVVEWVGVWSNINAVVVCLTKHIYQW